VRRAASTFVRNMLIAGALTCLIPPRVTFAADPKPDFTIKAKSIEAGVVLDAKIKDDPALAANCLAEGKAWAQKNFSDVVKGRKESPELFLGGDWTYTRSYDIGSIVGGRYVSVLRYDNSYTGGAHPNSTVDTILWDTTAKKRISIRPFFIETADDGPTLTAIRNAVVASLKVQKKKKDLTSDIDWAKGIEPKLLKIGPITLAPSTETGMSSGLELIYSPYSVGTYAEGEYVAFVPWTTVKPYLSPEGQRIFGGERPKSEDDAQQ
jgi:hypothetical protein